MNNLDRLQTEHKKRDHHQVDDDRYSLSNVSYRFMKSQLKRHVVDLLGKSEQIELYSCRLLEVGCGNGNILQDFHTLNVPDGCLFGIDLLHHRVQLAHEKSPSFSVACSDGQQLPFPAKSFNMVLQFTAFSSMSDDHVRKNVAKEMLRVLKPNGLILWYDFWLNPFNRQTHAIRPAEIRDLFPGCIFHFERITLAPPIARRLVPFSWGLALFLENLRVFNTHYLAVIKPLN